MALARELAGFTGAEADHLRKAIGKKDLAKMAEMKSQFIEGAMAGFVEVTLEDGRIVKVHRKRKLAVREVPELLTVEEVMAKGYTLLHSL